MIEEIIEFVRTKGFSGDLELVYESANLIYKVDRLAIKVFRTLENSEENLNHIKSSRQVLKDLYHGGYPVIRPYFDDENVFCIGDFICACHYYEDLIEGEINFKDKYQVFLKLQEGMASCQSKNQLGPWTKVQSYISRLVDDPLMTSYIERFQKTDQTLRQIKMTCSHGDPHANNMIMTARGLLWLDFEDISMMPVYWDQVSLIAGKILAKGLDHDLIKPYIMNNKDFYNILEARLLFSLIGNYYEAKIDQGDMDYVMWQLKKIDAILSQIDTIRSRFDRVDKILTDLEVKYDRLEELRYKDGIGIYKVKSASDYVLKCFDKEEFLREIKVYQMFEKHGLDHIRVIKYHDQALLLEDVSNHEIYRLATKEDMNDPVLVKRLAAYYKNLHKLKITEDLTYSEVDLINKDNLKMLKENLDYSNQAYWLLLEEFRQDIQAYLKKHARVTYNDFYYTNMVVSKDKSQAFMFDYNFVGWGLRAFDIKNVSSQLTDDNKSLFLSTYGHIDPIEFDIYRVLSPLISMVIGLERPSLPNWALEDKSLIESGRHFEVIKEIRKHWTENNY